MLKNGRCAALLIFGLMLNLPLVAEELLPAAPPAQPACHLVAHLNESKDLTDAAGLKLPRWYDLHHRLLKLLNDKAGCT